MADTTTYTTEKASLINDYARAAVASSLQLYSAYFNAVGKVHKKLGITSEEQVFRLPSSTNVQLNESGGANFTFPVRLDALGVTVRVSTELQTLNPQQKDQVRRATYSVETIATPIAISDLRINIAQGKEAVVDYVKEQIEAALEDHVNTLGGTSCLWSATSAYGITGLNHAIHTTATTAVGGIDGAVHSTWANQYVATTAWNTNEEGVSELTYVRALSASRNGVISLYVTDAAALSWMARGAWKVLAISNIGDDPFKGMPMIDGIPVHVDAQLSSDNLYGVDLRHFYMMVTNYKAGGGGGAPAFCLPLPGRALNTQLGEMHVIVTQGNNVMDKRDCHFVQAISAT